LSRIRELLSDSVIYGLSGVVARFINYLLVPFYTKFFNPAEYGIIGLIYAAIVFLNVIYTFGMESSYIRYAADRKQSDDVFKTVQVTLIGAGAGLCGLIWLLSPAVMPLMSLDGGGSNLFFMMLVILWLDALGIVPYAELRLVRKAVTYASIRLVNVGINVALNLYLVIVLGWGLEAILISNIIASLFSTGTLFIITLPKYKGVWSYDLLKTALLFGLPYVPNGIGFAINEVLDRFFLNAMSVADITRLYGPGYGPEEITGIYNACYKLAIFMLIVVQMFKLAWQPFFMRHSTEDDAPAVFRDVFRYFNYVSGMVVLSVGLFAQEIVQIRVPLLDATIIDSRYWMGLEIVPWLLLAYWFQGWFVNLSAGIFIRERTIELPGITLAGASVTILLNWLMVPVLGMTGSALATLCCYAVMCLILYARSRKVFPVAYQWFRSFGMMACAMAPVLYGTFLSGIDFSIYNKILLFLSGGAVMSVLCFVPSGWYRRADR
jgi:O-antigen/teichoic acid export membrane protein